MFKAWFTGFTQVGNLLLLIYKTKFDSTLDFCTKYQNDVKIFNF